MTRAEAGEMVLNQLAPEGKWVVDKKTGVVTSGVDGFCKDATIMDRFKDTKFPLSNQLISILVSHQKKVLVLLTSGIADPGTAAMDPINAGYRKPDKPLATRPAGSDSQVMINVNQRVQFNQGGNWKEFPLYIVLGHELRHALEDAQGSATADANGHQDEFFAIIGKRLMEDEHHIPIRPADLTTDNARVLLLDTNTFKKY